MSENPTADATLPDDPLLLVPTVFPEDEFPDPLQDPIDLGLESK